MKVKNQKGFTLLEVLLASVVLAVGITFMAPSFFRFSDTVQHLQNRYQVSFLLDESLWEARKHLIEDPDAEEYKRERTYHIRIPVVVTAELELKDGFVGLYELRLSAEWRERGSKKTQRRETLFTR